MREIKFRGQSQHDGEWVYGNLVGTNLIAGGIKIKYPLEIWNDIRELDKWEEVDPETVGQYTGKNDTSDNKKEIYEGDIVDYEDQDIFGASLKTIRGVIKFSEGGWIIDDEKNQQSAFLWSETAEVRKLGNIYDNPELLEDQQ